LVGASTAVVGSGLLAAGWPHGAAAASGETQPPPAQPERAMKNGADSPGLSGLGTGSVQANGLEFHYVEAGQGPLALCLHGFPDSPFTYRYLLPALAEAGYHAVCPYMRGYHPTQVPSRYNNTKDLATDRALLPAAVGGDDKAVLIAH